MNDTPDELAGRWHASVVLKRDVFSTIERGRYRTERGEVPDGEHVVPLGKARIAREGTDVTLVAYGAMVPMCLRTAEALQGEASCEEIGRAHV